VGANNKAHSPGRVPHVRLTLHGPKKMGRSPFYRSYSASERQLAERESWYME
jgi:hypothetical protein